MAMSTAADEASMAPAEEAATPTPSLAETEDDRRNKLLDLVKAYLPSKGSSDSDVDVLELESESDDHTSLDSMDDWSDERLDSEEYEDSESDEDGGWTSKSKKKKKVSLNSACEHTMFFSAMRKGFCSRNLDRRADPIPHAGKRQVKVDYGESKGQEGGDGASEVQTKKLSKGARRFSTQFKCTVLDTPKQLLKRASLSRVPHDNEQDVYARKGVADDKNKDEEESGKERRERLHSEIRAEREKKVLERGVKNTLEQLSDGLRIAENLCKDIAAKEYGNPRVEVEISISRKKSSSNLSNARDEPVNGKEEIFSHKKQSCWRESERKILDNKGDWKTTQNVPDSSSKSTKIQNRNGNRINAVESEEKEVSPFKSIENGCNEQEKLSKVNKSPGGSTVEERLSLAAEPSPVTTSSREHQPPETSKESEAKTLTSEAKLPDVPYHVYKKEKQSVIEATHDSKRKTKAKKTKPTKGKKVIHLFHDGFTLPSAREPDDDPTSIPRGSPREAAEIVIPDKEAAVDSIYKDPVLDLVKDKLEGDNLGTYNLLGFGARNGTHAQESNSSAREADPPVLATDTSGAASNLGTTNVSKADSLKGKPEGKKLTQSDSRISDSNTVTDAQGTDIPFADHTENLDCDEEPTSLRWLLTKSEHSALQRVEATAAHNPRNIREDSSKSVSTTQPPSSPAVNRDWLAASVFVPRGTLPPSNSAKTMVQVAPLLSNPAVSTSFTPYNFPVHPEVSNWEASSSTTDGNVGLVTPNSLTASVPSSSLPRVHLPAPPQSSSRFLTTVSMGINSQLTRFVQAPVSHLQYHGHNSVIASASGQEMMNPSSFYPDNRGIGNSWWLPPGSGVKAVDIAQDLSTLSIGATVYFGQVICCDNKTLKLYKQMHSFCIESKHLLNAPNIAPGTCALFLFNIDTRELHGLYRSSSRSWNVTSVMHEPSVAFDCMKDFSLPLTMAELDDVLPSARQMDGNNNPLFLQSNLVNELVTWFERKNWVSSTAYVSLPAGDDSSLGLTEVSSLPVSKTFTTSNQNHLSETRGLAPSLPFTSPFPASTTADLTRESWSSRSSNSSAEFQENERSSVALECAPPPPAHVFPSPVLPTTTNLETSITRPEVIQASNAWKPHEQRPAPSPTALWPHLFPKAGAVDHESVASSSSTQLDGKEVTASLSERTRIGVRADSETELGYGSLPESRVQHKVQRPKQAYNPLAMEQGRQKQFFEGSNSSSWSVGAGDHEYPQLPNLSHQRVQESHLKSSKMLPVASEQAKLVAMSTPSVPVLSSLTPPPQFPSTYQVAGNPPLDAPRNESSFTTAIGLQNPGVRFEELQSMNSLANGPETVSEAAPIDQTLCCYCFMRRADHLIIDCRHLGPCLECSKNLKIEYCAQPNCGIKVTTLLRMFL